MKTRLTPTILKRFRRRYNLSQAQAAAHIGVATITWSRWERGKSKIPIYVPVLLKPVADKLREIERIIQLDVADEAQGANNISIEVSSSMEITLPGEEGNDNCERG